MRDVIERKISDNELVMRAWNVFQEVLQMRH